MMNLKEAVKELKDKLMLCEDDENIIDEIFGEDGEKLCCREEIKKLLEVKGE